MHIVICLDDRNGLLFNKRRVSSDRAVSARIRETAAGTLWLHPYSEKLFSDVQYCAADDYLEKAGAGDTCFVESLDFLNCMEHVEAVTVYRWNRAYPADTKLPAGILAGWTLTAVTEFPGNSHERITEERYAL